MCKQHTASTALVLWNYNIALEPKCMLSEVAPMLLHRRLVSAECFQGFLAAYFICLEILNGFIVKKKTWEM